MYNLIVCFGIEPKQYKIGHTKFQYHTEDPSVIAETRTGLQKGQTIFVEKLNKEFTIDFVLNLSFDLDISIDERGDNSDETFYSAVKTI